MNDELLKGLENSIQVLEETNNYAIVKVLREAINEIKKLRKANVGYTGLDDVLAELHELARGWNQNFVIIETDKLKETLSKYIV